MVYMTVAIFCVPVDGSVIVYVPGTTAYITF